MSESRRASSRTDDVRPDPDALLAEARREQRGGLKVFLGAAPGVGKTYGMLAAARELRRQGVDVVIGVVEPHGRPETEALCAELERIPPMSIDYRDRRFEEFDLDAALERAPAVLLVDELAHRNIPGTRHPRRYQDIQELLEAGIDVWTAVNIQHLESLNDAVARITGVRMRETVPDELLAQARDVVLVDLTPRELIERLRQGKVYVPEQARAALDGFFSPANLTALRELALQTVAERIDSDVRESMQCGGRVGPWPVRTRILVAIDGIGDSEQLVRQGRRLAERRRAPWIAVWVDTGRVDPERRETVERAFQLAERLGGETTVLRGHDVVAELLVYAREHNVTTLVLGRSRERLLAGVFSRTLSQRLLRRGGEFEITFIASAPARMRRRLNWRRTPASGSGRHYLLAVAAVALSVIFSAVLERWLPLANLSLVFLTGVLLVAARTALYPALVTAVLSFLAYNFFFTEPRYTFTIHRTDELLTVLFFLLMALIGGNLAVRLRQQLLALRATSEQSQALLALSKQLAAAPAPADVQITAARAIARQIRVPACLLELDAESGEPRVVADAPGAVMLDDKARAAARWAFEHGRPGGFQTDTLTGVDWRFLPLRIDRECFAVLGLRLGELQPPPGGEQLLLIDALANQVTLALARTRLVTSLEQARVAEETERLRAALLSSVSHDLRTPLASMIGAASSLRELGEQLSTSDQQELLDAVLSEGERLNRYIQNLLDMTRLGHGTLKLERDWIALNDIVAAALRRCRELLTNLHVVRSIPDDLPLLYVHPALIEQALVNVIENAARFSPSGGEIRISAGNENGELLIEISDQGPGIPPEQRRQVFDMFFTGGEGDRGRHGSGLGLAICHGMVGAHGGRIEALPGPRDQGATIAIHLPLLDMPDDGENRED